MIIFKPDRDFPGAVTQARADVEAWSAIRGNQSQRQLAEWAGESLKAMLSDRDVTIRCLRSQNSSLRLAAASLLSEYWHGDECFAADALRIAFEDPEPSIRGAALVALPHLKLYIVDQTGFLGRLLRELFPVPEDVAAHILKTVRDGQSSIEAARRQAWERMAGVHATQMAESREYAESCLSHADPQVRCAALLILDMTWMSRQDFAELCQEIVVHDVDITVRTFAVASLAGCYVNTDDKHVGDFVARLVRDASSPHDVRAAAHVALLHIRGMPTEAFLRAMSQSFRFPEDVDWSFVESFIQGKEST